MSNNTPQSPLAPIMSIFWLINLIYSVIFWGGWHIFFNLFLPYAIIADVVMKFAHYIRP